ncbi:MAG: PLP-dependent transferase, partial [Pseudomonadota bacterium]
YPALPSAPGHALWKRDFHGASGLFTFVLNTGTRECVRAMVDGLEHFKLGFSWGGFESLILPLRFTGVRRASRRPILAGAYWAGRPGRFDCGFRRRPEALRERSLAHKTKLD